MNADDAVLDIEVTPNRPDWLSVVGIAREIAARRPLRTTGDLVEAVKAAKEGLRALIELVS